MKKMELYVGVWTKSCYGKQTNFKMKPDDHETLNL